MVVDENGDNLLLAAGWMYKTSTDNIENCTDEKKREKADTIRKCIMEGLNLSVDGKIS